MMMNDTCQFDRDHKLTYSLCDFEIALDNVIELKRFKSTKPKRRPEWLKVRAPQGEDVQQLKRLMRVKTLHTVCEEALCPTSANAGGAARDVPDDGRCLHALVCVLRHQDGRPAPMDWDEPDRVAQAIKAMSLRHAVITSVNRDERKDGGAPIFAMVIQRIREVQPGCTIEVLIPDFKGNIDALKMVTDAAPEILNHNVETVPSLFKRFNRKIIMSGRWRPCATRRRSAESSHQERHYAGTGRDQG